MKPKLTRVCAAVACAFAANLAQANGTDPTVVAGQANFSTLGKSLSITNTPGAIINWQGFSIGASETTRFLQQSTASSVLNRVIGPDPSSILGALTSNGRVFLINPSGILFGAGARIDVAGLVASTLSLSNQDFLAGRFNFTPNPLAGKVENQGSITTPSGGSVYLVGSSVSNSGIINSPQGDVILAAGESVKIFDTSAPGVRVELRANDNAAVNLGEILAQSGQVGIYGAALRNSGTIDANQVVRDAGGKIVLRAKRDVTLGAGSRLSANGEQAGEITVQSESGTTLVSGTIEAKGTGAGQVGGTVQVLGDRVGLLGGHINASGDAGGGTVLIGGDLHGANPAVQNASATYMSAGSAISADAITNGIGGKVVLWSNDSTRAYGSIMARGGAKNGDGGLIETSSHWLDVAGISVNAGAPRGKAGTWLLDPADVTITGAVDSGGSYSGANPNFFTPSSGASTANVNLTTITTALNAGTDVTISTTNTGTSGGGAGNISVDAVVTWSVTSPTTPTTLTLNAVADVNVNQAITATRGSFVANAGHDVNVKAVITTTDGNVVLRADSDGTGPGFAGGTVTFLTGGGVTMTRGAASIYYNPSAYSSPTDYSGKFTLTGSTLTPYMWVFARGNNKVYDRLTTASLSFAGDPATGGAVTLKPGTADFDTKNAGTGKTITYSGYSLDGIDANKFALFYGDIPGAGTTTADITKLDTNVSGTRVYDRTVNAAGTDLTTVSALIGADAVTVSGTGTVGDKNVGANKAVTNGGLALAGADAGNYNLLTAGNTLSITKLDTNVSGTRVYDRTVNAAGTDLTTVSALIGADAVTVSGTGTVGDKNVGANKAVTNGGLALAGADAGNYNLLTAGNTLSITKLDTNVSGTRVYDRTVNAAGTDLTTVSALIGADAVTVSGTGTVGDKNVGANKAVTNGGLALAGADAGNYNLLTAGNTLSITAVGITGNITAASKVYDRTDAATILTRTLTGMLGADTVNYSGGAANFDGKNVGTGKTVTGTGLVLAGADAGNYTVNSSASTTADITALGITGSITAANKIYDATDVATITGRTLAGVLGTDVVSYSGGAASFDTKNVGIGKAVTGTGLGLTGADAGNYTVNSSASTTADITALAITGGITVLGSITAANKVYDATDAATITGRTLAGVLGTDVVSYSGGAASFDSKNVGTGKTVTGTGLVLAGADAGNYTVNSSATTTADITARGITGSITAANKVYDATDAATITGRTLAGVLGADVVSYSGGAASFDTKNAGTGKTVTGTGLVLAGADAGNYTVNSTATTQANITPAPLGIAASSTTRLYGNVNPAFSATYTGFQNGESVAALNGALVFATPALPSSNVGNYVITPSGQSSANYTISYVNGALTVTPVTLVVAADARSKVYGTGDPALTFSVTGLVNNPALGVADFAGTVLSGMLARVSGETVAAGPYAITQGTLAANVNYTLSSFTANALTITPAALNVAAHPQTKLFGAIDPALTFSTTGLVNNPALGIADTAMSVLSGALTRVPGESALGGPYAITRGSLAPNSNYSLGFTPSNLIITGAALVPVLGVDPGQVVFVGVVNNETYYRPGNFWHIALNPDNADPGFDVMRGTGDLNPIAAREGEGQLSGFVSRTGRRESSCASVTGGGFCETWSFPQQRKKVDKQ